MKNHSYVQVYQIVFQFQSKSNVYKEGARSLNTMDLHSHRQAVLLLASSRPVSVNQVFCARF